MDVLLKKEGQHSMTRPLKDEGQINQKGRKRKKKEKAVIKVACA